ncbi:MULTISPECIES: NAD(P)H-quinone dehydrogenase [Thermomonospora]|uniref:NAD(P)H dehydrogenase (quinone) n=1 Tax=Thermomonospora curvata (strain ATCC 19995 / DSM 43183 / JCM 3096 / KCTC 9072 / NBRC 15933 / NCIMB 10081 / Henssen B9) TaxID=471852 RepID=D1A254_THECD|nr:MULTISPECIES: NAD(P)H-quinone dehydrogenase [Thermomonospora]ACY99707.1 pyridine nucleotide-disulphide oxidoreductase dimerization region [Thermomonospora curvata DSM 43183]PKK12722.1 MAG: NAD(P)H-quinone dehydrogenase [Thermomonospora sp. CIF 1]
MTRIVIIGGGPGGYEAALVAAQLGADVTIVERTGLGGACVLTDCVPSKTLIATSTRMGVMSESASLGLRFDGGPDGIVGGLTVDLAQVNKRVKDLARAQSFDVAERLAYEDVRIVRGEARLSDPHTVTVNGTDLPADIILIATGATPRVLPGAEPDGERILSWRHLYDLTELPEELIVVGSGVTGAELAGAYLSLGSRVTLISSRDRILPTEDADAAGVLQEVFLRRGMKVLSRSRAAAVERTGDGVVVTLEDGRKVEGSHCLMTVGMEPNTRGIGLEKAGVKLSRGFVQVDKVSRTSVSHIYAAGDCTGVMMLASVAAMQGRIAMWHALGEAVQPLKLGWVAANIFTDPEVATVGVTQKMIDAGEVNARSVMLPLFSNPRAKMQGFEDGFVKLFCRPSTGIVLGGVIVAPRASELILAVSLAVQQHLTVDQLAQTFAVYPSLSGSITEASRRLMQESAY